MKTNKKTKNKTKKKHRNKFIYLSNNWRSIIDYI